MELNLPIEILPERKELLILTFSEKEIFPQILHS